MSLQPTTAFPQLLALLRRLGDAKIAYTLRHSRDDAIMIEVAVPGERWEIEFVDYGESVQVEVEKFASAGEIEGERALDDLFAQYSDHEEVSHDAVSGK
jgi:hypothetical protein